MRVKAFLFPDPPRRIPAHRGLGVALRTAHLVAFGVLLGGHVFAVEPSRLVPFLIATLASGALLMALELASTCSWVLQGKGAGVMLKLLLLALVPAFWEQRVAILVIVVVVAGVSSHMPSRFRHRWLLRFLADSPSGRRAGRAPSTLEVRAIAGAEVRVPLAFEDQ